MSNQNSSTSKLKSIFASLVILVSLVVSILIYMFILGNPANFEEGNPANHPLPGNYLGIIYKGGVIVPLLMTVNLVVITFCIERFITISRSRGKGKTEEFVEKIREMLAVSRIDDAIAECDLQKGSLASVVKAGLVKYKQVESDPSLDKETKVAAIQKDLEEATALELPMLSKNLVILSTCVSIGTLIGLIGTVLGMIKAFSALANAGAPDTVALATGISEALINTALGIIASTVSVIMYNFFTTKIDALTYGMDEASFSIVQSLASKK